MPSLRQKIVLGYTSFAVLLVGLSVFYLYELRLIERQILAGGRVSELFDVALEIRRFEKNYFLYRQATDYRENAEFLSRARQLLDENQATFAELASSPRLSGLRGKLTAYAGQMTAYAATGQSQPKTAQAIRALGAEIVTIAQGLADAERQVLRQRFEQHGKVLLAALAGLLVLLASAAALVSRGIVRPLKDMENSMEAIAAGSTHRLDLTTRDREIVSLVRASNHMLDELRQRQQQQLLQADRLASLGRLISGVAHEVNNPLSNISSSAQILLEDGEMADPVWLREMLTQIDDETTRAQRIVRSLLDYARERDFQRASIALKATVEETLRFMRNEISARVAVRLDIPDTLLLDADKPRLQQVFLNLLKNAVEALADVGEVRVSATRHAADDPAAPACFRDQPRCALGAEVVDIEVRDDGQGIPPEVLPHIFEPFYSTKEASKGSGLGLFIVREIVEQHGGCIAAESEPGRYTAFHIRLPQTLGTQAQSPETP